MSKDFFIAAVAIYVTLIGLGIYLWAENDARRAAVQLEINDKIIKALDDQIQTNDLVLDYLKTISKKSGH